MLKRVRRAFKRDTSDDDADDDGAAVAEGGDKKAKDTAAAKKDVRTQFLRDAIKYYLIPV